MTAKPPGTAEETPAVPDTAEAVPVDVVRALALGLWHVFGILGIHGTLASQLVRVNVPKADAQAVEQWMQEHNRR